ncbi:hypothetical protein N657DRAFT_646681 [Parathielavia appendiculata]|uniref:Uncharacterized protein n=1 Tax=Parathielavia appendiculata TaxID=2587402 RepID=A0AAN6Z2X8_9PEZI|nr:hypothetical protein N657DRAFT_646681 [Parathielavia appendiculata]
MSSTPLLLYLLHTQILKIKNNITHLPSHLPVQETLNINQTNKMHGSSCPKCGASSDGASKSCGSCGASCPN